MKCRKRIKIEVTMGSFLVAVSGSYPSYVVADVIGRTELFLNPESGLGGTLSLFVGPLNPFKIGVSCSKSL